jgi:hypothetical protein
LEYLKVLSRPQKRTHIVPRSKRTKQIRIGGPCVRESRDEGPENQGQRTKSNPPVDGEASTEAIQRVG